MLQLRSTRTASFSILFAAILGILFFCLAGPASASDSQPSSESDLICHTSDPEECYPRIFQPSDEFQIVRDDQELPNGLHVRLNIWTGQKEAKINVPDEDDAALEGLPVDQAVVIVEPEQPEAPQIPKGAPKYDPVGKVKEPQVEAIAFAEAFKMLKSGVSGGEEAFDNALEGLEELSHDIYYGLKITEDSEMVKALFCLMGDHDGRILQGVTPRDQQAAAILAGALSNNPSALEEVAEIWTDLMGSKCPRDGSPLRQRFYSSFIRSDSTPAKVKATVSAINGLIKSKPIRRDFLNNDGMSWLLEVLIPEGKEWAAAQRKAGQLVLDTFLDEDMGAELGQWPKKPKLSGKQCQSVESRTEEGCWDHHVERVMKANKGDTGHWSRDLHGRLAAARKASARASKHEDL